MKTRLLTPVLTLVFAVGAFVSPASAVPPTREELTKIYRAGVAAFQKEDFVTAEREFRKVLQYVPQQPQARKYLIDIERKRAVEASIPPLQKELSKLIVPEISAEETTLEDFLSLVGMKVKELTEGKTVPNFVFRPSTPDLTDRLVTLKLTAIPASELLRQAGQITDTKFTYEKYAIVVTPARSSAIDAETTAALDAAAKTAQE
jgi:hypothetical protein